MPRRKTAIQIDYTTAWIGFAKPFPYSSTIWWFYVLRRVDEIESVSAVEIHSIAFID